MLKDKRICTLKFEFLPEYTFPAVKIVLDMSRCAVKAVLQGGQGRGKPGTCSKLDLYLFCYSSKAK